MFDFVRGLFKRPAPPAITTRNYDAASGGRRWRGSDATPSLQSAILAGREPVARRARYAATNQPLAKSAEEVFCGEAVGSGMRPVPQTGDDALDATISAAFEEWTDRADALGLCSFYGLQAHAAGRYWTDGEWFAIFMLEDDELRVRSLDPAQVNPALSMVLPDGGAIVCGVEVNRLGKPIGFHVFKHWIPGLPLLTNFELTRVEATDVLHLFRVEGAGQTRGMSRLAAVLLRLRELDSLTDGQLVRLKIGAILAGFIVDADGTLLAGENPGEV